MILNKASKPFPLFLFQVLPAMEPSPLSNFQNISGAELSVTIPTDYPKDSDRDTLEVFNTQLNAIYGDTFEIWALRAFHF